LKNIKTDEHDAIILSSRSERETMKDFIDLIKVSPLPDDEVLPNMGLFLTSKALSRILFFYEIYKKIIYNHGVIMEFGVRWGQTLSIMSALRGIFEPYNRHRKIVGFDSFQGLVGISEKDGGRCSCIDGSFSVTPNYEAYLDKLLSLQDNLNPIAHLKKYELVRGNAIKTVPTYFENHPETIVSLAVFDFDIYEPTRIALEAVKPHLCKGSILVFDELCDDIFPGETIALQESLNLNNLRIQRMPMTSRISYIVIE